MALGARRLGQGASSAIRAVGFPIGCGAAITPTTASAGPSVNLANRADVVSASAAYQIASRTFAISRGRA
jgi:hypothetical protein